MFTCPNCGAETDKLIGAEDVVKCPACHTRKSKYASAHLHIKAGLGREAKNVTIPQKNHILDRTISADGTKVVHKSNPNRIWSW